MVQLGASASWHVARAFETLLSALVQCRYAATSIPSFGKGFKASREVVLGVPQYLLLPLVDHISHLRLVKDPFERAEQIAQLFFARRGC